MYVPACQHHDRACAGCGRQLAWTWPGRGAVRAQHAVHCSRGPARTLGFIIYIYIYQQVCRLWCVHFIRTSDMARFGHCPYSAVPVLLGRRPAAALVKKNPPAPQKLQTPFPRASQSMCAPGAPRRCLGEKKTACPSKTADAFPLGAAPRSGRARRGPPTAALVKIFSKNALCPWAPPRPLPARSPRARQGAPAARLGGKK